MSMAHKSPIILAVDTSSLDTALEWVACTSKYISAYKLGLEFFLSFGGEGVRRIAEVSDAKLFLDLKLHDIPNTVAGASAAVAALTPAFVTVHASGGRAMISAAVQAAPLSDITAVTILTSLDDDDVKEIGYGAGALPSAVNLAKLALEAGAKAIVCSPLEISAMRQNLGKNFAIITPGIRPADHSARDDQARTMTPREAIDAGATYLVIGRPITQHAISGMQRMQDAAAKIVDDIYSGNSR